MCQVLVCVPVLRGPAINWRDPKVMPRGMGASIVRPVAIVGPRGDKTFTWCWLFRLPWWSCRIHDLKEKTNSEVLKWIKEVKQTKQKTNVIRHDRIFKLNICSQKHWWWQTVHVFHFSTDLCRKLWHERLHILQTIQRNTNTNNTKKCAWARFVGCLR